jgi:peptidyl-prolyl cis-trans isomerase C
MKPVLTLFPSRRLGGVLLGVMLLLAACRGGVESPTPTPAFASPVPAQPTQTSTPFQPSPTPQPLAARVNGEEITLTRYQAELARYQAAVGTQLATEDEQRVINDMIDRTLLAQAAAETGFKVDATAVQSRIVQLISQLGSDQALVDWMASNGYTEESFRADLAQSLAAAWMRDKIVSSVPTTAEQVHARQILLYNSEDANKALAELSSGKDFAALAAQYDPVAKGDLGWFPRGYLTDQKLEEVAFSLQPGESSQVIETKIGYHVLQVIERDPSRALDPDARLTLQMQALGKWLADRRANSEIQILLP